jgi:XTP/dITP diphosphohydrolase
MPRVLIATNNPGKAAELRALLADCGWESVIPSEIGLRLEVEESGATCAENASLKAVAFARASGLVAVADDVGLEVNALGGAPSVHAKRFWGSELTDAERNARLLDLLAGVPDEQRTARFVAAIAVATPQGEVEVSDAVLVGRIAQAARGDQGFGYDPIFELPRLGRTVGELSPNEKNRISHRALAAQGARRWLGERIRSHVSP